MRDGPDVVGPAATDPAPARAGPFAEGPSRGCCRTAATCSGRWLRWWSGASCWPAWSDVFVSARRDPRGTVPSYNARRRCKADAAAAGIPDPAARAARQAGRPTPVPAAGSSTAAPIPRPGNRPRGTSKVGYIAPSRMYREPDPEQRRRGRARRLHPLIDGSDRRRRTSTGSSGWSTKAAEVPSRCGPPGWTAARAGPDWRSPAPGSSRRLPYPGHRDTNAAALCPARSRRCTHDRT